MSKFALLAPYLESEDITEIVLQTGRAPCVKMAGEYRPITGGAFTTLQIEELVAGTPIAMILPTADAAGAPRRVMLAGRPHVVRVSRRGDSLEIRVEHGEPLPGRRSQATPSVTTAATAPKHAAREPPPAKGSLQVPSVSASPRRRRSSAARPAVTMPAATPIPVPVAVARAEAAYAEHPARVAGAPVPGRLVAILAAARGRRASDVHVVSDRPVLVRTAGVLLPVGDALSHDTVQGMLLPLLDARQRKATDKDSFSKAIAARSP